MIQWAAATVIRLAMWVLFLLAVIACVLLALVFVFTGRCDYSRMQFFGMDRISAGVLNLPSRGYLTISAECANGSGWRSILRWVLGKLDDNHCGDALKFEIAWLRHITEQTSPRLGSSAATPH